MIFDEAEGEIASGKGSDSAIRVSEGRRVKTARSKAVSETMNTASESMRKQEGRITWCQWRPSDLRGGRHRMVETLGHLERDNAGQGSDGDGRVPGWVGVGGQEIAT